MAGELLLEHNGEIAVLTLNRQESYNSINTEMLKLMSQAIQDIRFNPDIRVLIITGAGEKAFCSGADLKERITLSPDQVRQFIHTNRTNMTALEDLPIPVIAAINGLALGGGTELALACDLRVAADTAVLGLTEVTLAIIPGAGGTQRLSRLVGRGKAKELILTGRKISAGEALNIGLVNQVVPGERLLTAAKELAAEIAANGPIAVRQAKLAVNKGLEIELGAALTLETAAYEACIPTEDRLEGLKAFKEKRKPMYKGK